jgi:hypothetical protein
MRVTTATRLWDGRGRTGCRYPISAGTRAWGRSHPLIVDPVGSLPAVAGPVGVADGPPQLVQIGPRYREGLCLDAAQPSANRTGTLTPVDPR